MKDFETECAGFYRDVFRYACALCGDPVLAEEMTQDAFAKAFLSFGGFRGQCSPYTWLCGIVKNVYRTHLRREKRVALQEEAPEAASDDTTEEAVLSAERQKALHEALHALPEPYKEVFTLRVFGELHYAQIASLFGKSESWARVVYYRAKGMMRDAVKEEEI